MIDSRGAGQASRSTKGAADSGGLKSASFEGGSRRSFEVPGQLCPPEIHCIKLMEVIPQQRHSGLKQFWRRSLRPTHAAHGSTPRSSDVWPCPPLAGVVGRARPNCLLDAGDGCDFLG